MNDQLARFNALNEKEAWEELLRCCGASQWALKMLAAHPFPDQTALFAASAMAFETLGRGDWLEAFAHHPKIGDLESLRRKFAATREWAGNEQAGAGSASEDVLQGLAQGNRLYEAKFGFIFIICATGKSAGEMLAALQTRLENDRETEISNAAGEQKQITDLRLRKLLES